MSQVTGDVPSWQQEPWHVSHSTAVSTSMSRCAPKTTSPRSSVTRTRASCPRSRRERGRAPATAALGGTEERLEDVAEPAESAEVASGAVSSAHVVAAPRLVVAQHVVRMRDELELLRRILTGIHIRVQLSRETSIRLLDLVGGSVSGHPENLIVVRHNRLSACVFRSRPRQRPASSSSSIRDR